MHYNYFRDFEPAIGRYVQSDPIGLRGGLSTYAYVYDSPLGFSDAEGLMGQGSNGGIGRPMPGTPGFGGAGAKPGFCGSGWNEPFVPDGFGTVDFNDACKKHDECYSRCGASKQECDLELRRNMRRECDKLPLGGQRGFCRTLAIDYGVAVDTFGGSAYRNAQRQSRGGK
ncbi:MAG: hypothetical protein IPJ28_01985 [Betaproteobacteria bacterium]|nr:hypothetical protein [Betaproteobacteria bacterium]